MQPANGKREGLSGQNDGSRDVEAVADQPAEARCLAPDGARIITSATLREGLERHEPRRHGRAA
jgi:hypothetical protein